MVERDERHEGAERNVYAILSPPKSRPIVSLSPVCATRCGLTQKGPRTGNGVTERAGKGKIRRQQQAGGKTKNSPAYIEAACDDDDDHGGGGGGGYDDDEGGTHT